MSKRLGNWSVRLPLSAALGWCKKVTSRYFGFADRTVLSRERRQGDQFQVMQETNVNHSLQIEFCGDRIALKDLTAALRIGDRVRLFCDDGVVWAEKISQTQLKIIHSQAVADLMQ